MVVVFDLDDTLYKEVDFLKSAYHDIAERINVPEAYELMWHQWQSHGDPFGEVINTFKLSYSKSDLIEIYRYHKPQIKLTDNVRVVLDYLKKNSKKLGIITDGRTITQMNKLEALGLFDFFSKDNIIISEQFGAEKPNALNYKYFMNCLDDYCYIADNPQKDFLAPNSLGWKTICLLDDGRNVHPQKFNLPQEYLPQICIKDFSNVLSIL